MTTIFKLYTCRTGHKLSFGHSVSKKGLITDYKPAYCLSCGTPFDGGMNK